MVNTSTPVLKVRNTGIVICDDQEARNNRIAPQLAQCKGKGKAPCSATEKETLTPSNVLQILKERNGGVVIREKPPCQANGKENQAPNGSVISNAAAAQRARREREKMLPSKAAVAQQARRQRHQNYSPKNPLTVSKTALAQRRRREREKNEKNDGASCSRKRSEPESENAMENFPEGSVILPPTPRLVDGFISDRTPLTSTLQNHHKRRRTEYLRSIPTPRNLINDFADVAPPTTEYATGSTSSDVPVLQDQFSIYEVLGDDEDEDAISCDPPVVNVNATRLSLSKTWILYVHSVKFSIGRLRNWQILHNQILASGHVVCKARYDYRCSRHHHQ